MHEVDRLLLGSLGTFVGAAGFVARQQLTQHRSQGTAYRHRMMVVPVGFLSPTPDAAQVAAVAHGNKRPQFCIREIILPLALPGLATTAILTFVYCWNEFLFALSFTVGPDRQTVPVAIALFRGQYQVPWGQILAATVVATAPVGVLVLLFQRRIVRGLTAGAVKG